MHITSLASRRKQRWRALQKAGGAVLRVRIRDINALTAALLDLGWLDERKSEDREQIAAAVAALLDDLAKRGP